MQTFKQIYKFLKGDVFIGLLPIVFIVWLFIIGMAIAIIIELFF